MKIKSFRYIVCILIVFIMTVSVMAVYGLENGFVNTELSCDKIGNIFVGKNITIIAKIENSYTMDKNIKYEVSVVNEDGDRVYAVADSILVPAMDNKNIALEFDVPQFGFYNAKLKIDGITSSTTRFSVIRKSEKLNMNIGMNTHYASEVITNIYPKEYIQKFQKLVYDAGFGQAREGVTWAHYEGTENVYRLFDTHQEILGNFKNFGQNNLLLVGHENLAREIGFPVSEDELEAWKTYVERLMTDIKEYGIKDFEIWNEVNIYRFNDSTGTRRNVTPEEYVELLKVTYPVIHEIIGDEARVFGFAYSPDDYKFMEECLKLGAGDYMDGISTHPYSYKKIPEHEQGFVAEIVKTREIMEKYGIGDKVLINSETGYMNDLDFPLGTEPYANYDGTRLSNMNETEQAYNTVRKSAVSVGIIESTNWYYLMEQNMFVNHKYNSEQIGWGWLKHKKTQYDPDDYISFEAKPVFVAMASYNSLMADAESNGHIQILDGNGYIYKFKKDGKDIWMLWSINGADKVKLDIGADKVTVYDFYGNERNIETDNGIISLDISEKPQYIEGNFSKLITIDKASVYFTGKTDNPNAKMAVAVLKSGADINSSDENDYVYLNEIKTDENGNYVIQFKDLEAYSGEYIIKFRLAEETEEYGTYEYEYPCKIPKIVLTSSNGEVEKLKQIENGRLDAEIEILNIFDESIVAMAVCGVYKDGALVNAINIPAEFSEENNRFEISFTGIDTENADLIKIFLWNSDNYSPISDRIVVK